MNGERRGLFASSYPRVRLRHARQSLDTNMIRHHAKAKAKTLKGVHVFLQSHHADPTLMRAFELEYAAFIFEPEENGAEAS